MAKIMSPLVFFTIIVFNLSLVFGAIQSCTDLSNVEVNPQQVTGIWYENARAPNADSPICVSLNGTLTNAHYFEMKVKKIDKQDWLNKTVSYNLTVLKIQQGFFSVGSLSDQYKVIYLEPSYNLAIMCARNLGTTILTAVTRSKNVTEELRNQINSVFASYGADQAITTWVEQNKCYKSNSAQLFSSLSFLAVAVICIKEALNMKLIS